MIKTIFFQNGGQFIGFESKGHANYAKANEDDIVCAYHSGSCALAANILTDVFMQKALIETDDGYLKFVLNNKNPSREVSGVLKGLYLHLEQLSKAYPSNVKVTVTEV